MLAFLTARAKIMACFSFLRQASRLGKYSHIVLLFNGRLLRWLAFAITSDTVVPNRKMLQAIEADKVTDPSRTLDLNLQLGQRWPQVGPELAQSWPKSIPLTQVVSKTTQSKFKAGPKSSPRTKSTQSWRKVYQSWPKAGPKLAQVGPKSALGWPKSPQSRPKSCPNSR